METEIIIALVLIIAGVYIYSTHSETTTIQVQIPNVSNISLPDILPSAEKHYEYQEHGVAYFEESKYFYVNYTKPSTADNQSLWQVRFDTKPATNYSIASCWNAYSDTVAFRLMGMINPSLMGDSEIACWNGTGWLMLDNASSQGNDCPYITSVYNWKDGNWSSGVTANSWGQYTGEGDNVPYMNPEPHLGAGCQAAQIYEEAMWWYMQ